MEKNIVSCQLRIKINKTMKKIPRAFGVFFFKVKCKQKTTIDVFNLIFLQAIKKNAMYTGMLHTHKLVVVLFLFIYLIKTVLLLLNKNEGLAKFTKMVKVPEMIVSFLFLATGIYLIIGLPQIKPILIVKIICVFAAIPLAVIGFKKQNKALAALSLLLIIASYGMAEMSKKATKVEIAVTTPDQLGKSVYAAQCQACHGEDGKLGMAGSKDLTATNMVKDDITLLLNNGKNAMPKFKDALSTEEIDAVSEYVLQMKK